MKVKLHLSLEELERVEREEPDAAQAKRLRMVILAMKGYTAPAIAMSLGPTRRICQRWVRRYNEFGLAGLDDRRGGRPRRPLSPEQEAAVRQRIEEGPTAKDAVCSLRGQDIRRILAAEFDVLRSLASVYRWLHQWGFSYLRPRPRHRRVDPEAQAQFRRELPARLAAIAAEHVGQELRVYFQDESRFGQQGTTTNIWAQKGSRPTAIRQTEYDYLWVAGSGLSADWSCGRIAQPATQYRDREYVFRAILPNLGCARTCRDDLGWSRLSYQPSPSGAQQRDAAASATLQPRAEPHRKPVALPEEPLLVQPRLR
jgi:transposase